MYYIFIITLLLMGMVAASSWVEKTIPPSKDLIAFLKPSAGWIGLVGMVLGAYWFLRMLFNLGSMLKYVPMLTIIYMITAFVMFVLGLLLAQNQLRAMASSNEKATDSVNKIVDKFAGLTEKLGFAALILGLLVLILRIT